MELVDMYDLGSYAQAWGFESLHPDKWANNSVGLEYLSDKEEVVGSNPSLPTNCRISITVSMPGFQPGDVSSILVFCTMAKFDSLTDTQFEQLINSCST